MRHLRRALGARIRSLSRIWIKQAPLQAVAETQNDFDRNEGWANWVFNCVFLICSIVAGYATFSGMRMLITETGEAGSLVDGTAILITIAVVAMLTTGQAALCRWGPDARSPSLKVGVLLLGLLFTAFTLATSATPNLIALIGFPAKVHDWQLQHESNRLVVNELGERALGVTKLRAPLAAEKERTCRLAGAEAGRGLVSGAGAGSGVVAAALAGGCFQLSSFIQSAETALRDTEAALIEADAALASMKAAIRNRTKTPHEREDEFLAAGDRLNAAIQKLRTVDLSKTLEAGAKQVQSSVAVLDGSSASGKQIQAVAGLKQGLDGLVESITTLTTAWRDQPPVSYTPVRSLSHFRAIQHGWTEFLPTAVAAIAVDLFAPFVLLLMMVLKAGRGRPPAPPAVPFLYDGGLIPPSMESIARTPEPARRTANARRGAPDKQ